MNTTSVSLLDRLRVARPDDGDWRRMHDIYLPLIRRWLGRVPGVQDEAADLAQEVLIVVVRELPWFERRREGSFRAWLRQVTVNRLRTSRRQQRRGRASDMEDAQRFLDGLADPHSELSRQWDIEYERHVFQKLLEIVRPDFSARTWQAFQRFAIEQRSAAEVAAELGLSENAVLQAKSRILRRLREEAGELLG